ncbi:MFS transporter [Candidatus Odyssella acanthamoebae]|uniref:MFS transporter n=1 Tax=Candidatus Odyssella acanthamoebae TaxID=91604 RepID=UPI0006919999|nr:MFS transporter [Candidatus Paracaedibacter acanthamoebae]
MGNLATSKKKSFALIQIGAFLEYFDLYLYVHMAVLLNDIFFPKTDPYTAGLIAAFTFSSTYILRPIGALVFGYLGDNYGRKSTIIITTSLMAFCSFVIASLPSYEKIGITASIVMILCRMLQGFSSIGEFIGALTYVAESTKAPQSYFYTSLVAFFTGLGSTFALLVGSVFLMIDSNEGWRTAFYFGAAIAVIGSVARTQLRETPEFLQEKKQTKSKQVKLNQLLPSKQTKKYFFCYLGVECLRPLYFYFSFIYLGQFLRTHFGYSAAEVIHHNLFISGVEAIAILVYGRMALKIYPLDILKVRGLLFLGFAFCLPFMINHAATPFQLFLIQCGLLILGEGVTPAHALFLKAFPIIGRYTQAALAYAISRIITTILTSYGCVFIGEYYGIVGITGFLIMAILLHLYSIYQFNKNYDTKSQEIYQH